MLQHVLTAVHNKDILVVLTVHYSFIKKIYTHLHCMALALFPSLTYS